MNFATITFEQHDNGVGLLTLNRPEVMNALNRHMFAELSTLFTHLAATRRVRGLVVTGAGKAFAAGADLAEIQDDGIEEHTAYAGLGQSVLTMLEFLPIPTVAAINGFALGGGCELSLVCDMRLAGNRAAFGLPEVTLGVIPCFGGTQRLADVVGPGRAREMVFTGRIVKAEEALSIGLVEYLFEDAELLPKALEIAAAMARNSPAGIRYAKLAMNRGRGMHLSDGLELEKELSGICYGLPDKAEGIKAFLAKRPPAFTRAAETPSRD